ncbi:hypothetical protein GQ600_22086 [Phytophthora cactorum]|nr:hypothetical protein GQ600_22086 [Phytophthora cactorum]
MPRVTRCSEFPPATSAHPTLLSGTGSPRLIGYVSNVGLDAEILALSFGAKLFGGCDESADILLLGATENCCRLLTITPRPRNFGLVGIADIYGDAVIARWTRVYLCVHERLDRRNDTDDLVATAQLVVEDILTKVQR